MATQDEYLKYAKNFGMRPEFYLCSIENTNIDILNKNIYQEICNWPAYTGRGVYVFGTTGTGKSHIMRVKANLIYHAKIDSILRREKYEPRYFQWIELPKYITATERNKSFDSDHDDNAERIERETEDADVLFIDDFGATSNTPTMIQKVFKLIDARSQNGKQTFITSNLSPHEVKDFYGERIFSRVIGMCEVRNLNGPDRRFNR